MVLLIIIGDGTDRPIKSKHDDYGFQCHTAILTSSLSAATSNI